MKIAICASMTFAKEMLMAEKELKSLGHEVVVPLHADKYAEGTMTIENKWEKIEHDLIRGWFEVIKNSDAILVLNYSKNGVANYIGGNALMEMGFAHVLHKKIFLLNPVPELNYKDEIEAMMPVILGDDLTKIN
jgi:hypothetical protein